MSGALLIGFTYSGKLASTWKDLIIAFNWSKSRFTKVLVLTDTLENLPEELVFHTKVIYNSQQLTERVEVFVHQKEQLFFYYTGHGLAQHLILPDQTHYQLNRLRNNIFSSLQQNGQMVAVLDCCNPGNWQLPFHVEEGRFVLRTRDINFFSPACILIISSTGQQKSLGSFEGSLFTVIFFSTLSQTVIISELLTRIREKVYCTSSQSVQIYSTYIMRKFWNWLQ